MTISHLLEDFGGGTFVSARLSDGDDIALEEARLESFENGYSAGWEDAVKAHADDRNHVSRELAQNLRDLSFTYQEAYDQMVGTVTPVLEAITHQLLPDAMQHALGAVVIEEMQTLAFEQGNLPVEIVTAPSSVAAVSSLIPRNLAMPVRVVPDQTLVDGQAFLRVGQEEREVNLDSLLTNITNAIDAFVYQVHKELTHG